MTCWQAANESILVDHEPTWSHKTNVGGWKWLSINLPVCFLSNPVRFDFICVAECVARVLVTVSSVLNY